MKTKHRRTVVAVIAAFAFVGALFTATAPTRDAQAADGGLFNPGYIISDQAFYDSTSMTAGNVQSFIQSKGAGCRANDLPCLKDVVVNWPAQGGTSYCAPIGAGSGNAGQAIAVVSQACSISPRVMLVLIEKEQSLVTRSSPSSYAYRYATGFGCPDTSGCSDAVAGFFVQLYSAGAQFQRYKQNPYDYNYVAGRVNNIQFHPNAGCGTQAVYIQNQATAGLYDYTPYVPNQAALNNLYGTGDSCSSYGNRNFWRIFTDWFGDPAGNLLNSASFEQGIGSWTFMGSNDRAIYNNGTAQSGANFLAVVPHTSNASVGQAAARSTTQGEVWNGSVWVRAARGTVTGKVVVWGLGGQAENFGTSFTVGTTWTQISTSLLINNPGHSQVKLEVYFGSTDQEYYLDNAILSLGGAQTTRAPLAMSSPGFESGLGAWTAPNGTINRAIYSDPSAAHSGTSYFAMNTDSPNRSFAQDVPTRVDSTTGYTATIWLKSSSPTTPYSGSLVLWGLGGSATTNASTSFTVGNTWTKVQTTMPVTASNQSAVRLEVYLPTTKLTLFADDASITPNLLPDGSFEGNVAGWSVHEAGTNLAVYPSATGQQVAVDGSKLAATNMAVANGSIQADLARTLRVGETYTASIWVRAASPGARFSGTLALWGLGGTNTAASQPFSVTDQWTEVTVTQTITQSNQNSLRLQLYGQTPGVTIFVDGSRLY